jgi:hypothetical protein
MNVEGRKRGARNGDKSETMVKQFNENGKLMRKGKKTTTKTGGAKKGRGEPHLHTRPTDDSMTEERASLRLLSTHPKPDEGKLEGRLYSPA